MLNKQLKMCLILFLIGILLTTVSNAASVNYSGGLITGTFVIGSTALFGGANLRGGVITSNISIGEVISGANYTGGIFSGSLGYINGILNLPPIINTINLLPTAPQVNDTLYCNVTATDSEGATLTIFREWYNITGTQAEVTSFRNDQTVNSSDITFAERYFCRAKAFDNNQNSTDWVVSGNVSINDTIAPVISNPVYPGASAQNDVGTFNVTCTDGGSRVQDVTIEVRDPNNGVLNSTASLITGNTYGRSISLSTIGNYTFQSVTCRDWANQTTLTNNIAGIVVVTTGGSGGSSGSGNTGGGGSPSYQQTSYIKQTYVVSDTVRSPAGNWTVSTASEKNEYSLQMTKNDIIQGRSPILVTNIGSTILDFTLSCSNLGTTDPNHKDACDYVGITTKNFTLVPEQKQLVDITFTSTDFPNGALYSYDIVTTDNSNTAQKVRYSVTISIIYGTILKILRTLLTTIGLFSIVAGLITSSLAYRLARKEGKGLRLSTSIISGLIAFVLILLYV